MELSGVCLTTGARDTTQWGLVNGSSAQDSVPGREGDFILDAARLEADGQHGVVVVDVRFVSHSLQIFAVNYLWKVE